MTSKEALQEINNILWEEVPFSHYDHLTAPIEKDLEVLDLVKKVFVYDDYCGFDIDFRKVKPIEREKIKEWLLER